MPYRRLEDWARRRTGGAWGYACIWAAVLALPLGAARGADAPADMARYALTTADGKTRIVAAPPKTSENITGVMQLMSGPADGVRFAALVSGKLATLAGAEKPATVALTWDGKAWLPAAKIAPDAKLPAWKPATVVAAEKARTEAVLADLQANAAKATSENGKPLADLAKAEVAGLDDLARQDEFVQPAGEVRPVEKPLEGQGVTGIAKPLTASRTVPHRVQVWLAPAGAGMAAVQGREFTYDVQMAHARAGRAGACYYVAYADTNGDGLPDQLIARSPLAMCARDGGWTGWSFSSSEHVVFVGNAWADGATEVFFAEAGPGQEEAWTGISHDVDISALFCGLPNVRMSKQTFLTNIRFRVQP